MGGWNFADVYETVARQVPDAPCQVHGERVVTWGEFDRRSNGLTRALLAAGLQHQSKVAAYLYNCPEFMETYIGAWKGGFVPVNTNYRYAADEIVYLFDNADAEAVVFHGEFAPLIDGIRGRLPKVKLWLLVDDGNPVPDWATPYEDGIAAGATDEPALAPWGRSDEDILLLYTGGTTGMPKGVMWRQGDLFKVLGGGGNPILGVPAAKDLEDLASRITGPGPVMLPACPMMHGTGQFTCFINLMAGGSLISQVDRRFSAERLWQDIADHGVNALVIVGDAFARPLLAELDKTPDRWDLSNLAVITSSGVMWSQETKDGLMRHLPNIILFDSLGSSEAVGLASNVSAAGASQETASFKIGDRVKVITEDGREVQPGSDEIGMVSISGAIPLGYYKDEEKSAKTFRTVDGVRYSMPGDFAQVTEDGGIHLLGRGSVVINTGGEKVFPEEVEEALKQHPSVNDAVCVGVPDERFGEAICAMVEPAAGAAIDTEALIEHVKGRLARYKAPRIVLTVPTIGRAPNGKVDYKGLRAQALERLDA
jgi:acyl-CoA synthetase (AMP-forming)/AMP-acid ligase II